MSYTQLQIILVIVYILENSICLWRFYSLLELVEPSTNEFIVVYPSISCQGHSHGVLRFFRGITAGCREFDRADG